VAAKPKPGDPKQAAAFHKAARGLGADAGDDQFKGVLRTLAKAKPAPEKRKAHRPTKP